MRTFRPGENPAHRIEKLYIATPGDTSEKTFDEWFEQVDILSQLFPCEVARRKRNSSDIALNRNKLVEDFLASGYNVMLFVDTDMVWTAGQVVRLLDDDRDIVAGLMTQRAPPAMPTIGQFGEISPGRKASLVGRGRFYVDRVFEVDFIGSAFMVIRRNVFETIPPPWYVMHARVWGEEHEPVAEDIYFCWKAKQYGYRIWVDGRVQVGHKGYYVYTIWDYLRYTGLKQLEDGAYPDLREVIEGAH